MIIDLKSFLLLVLKKNSLEKFVRLQISKNEKREPNEFLRILDNDLKIKTV